MHGTRRIATLILFSLFAFASDALAANAPPPMTLPGQFNVSATGAATYSMPIVVPPGTAGMVPSLALDYSSQTGDGIVGYGWQLDGLPQITRCPRSAQQDGVHGGVNYDTNDRFCFNGQRLILTSGTYGADSSQYRTEIDSFAKIIAHGTAGNGPAWFEVHEKSGLYLEFGNTTSSQVLAVGKTSVRVWAVDKVKDTKGNYYTVTYTNDTTNGQYYPTEIDYTGNAGASLSPYNSVKFTYNTSRSDVTPAYQAGSLIQTTVLLTDIKTYQGSNVVYHYELAYRAGTSTVHSRLTSVTLCDNAGTNCLAPTTFGWQGGTGQLTMTGTANGDAQGQPVVPGDFNGDGLTDALIGYNCNDSNHIYLGSESSGLTYSSSFYVTGASDANVCDYLRTFLPLDIQPDGFTDIATAEKDDLNPDPPPDWVLYSEFYVGGSSAMSTIDNSSIPTGSTLYLGDFNGDGRSDYFIQATTSYAYLGNGDGTFTADSGHSGLGSGTIYVGDFDGDGCSDILDAASTSVVDFFCNPATSSVTTPSLSGYTITLLDVNGDGKTDILLTSKTAAGKLYLSTGTGFTLSSCSIPSGWGKYAIYTGDVNGDGKTDLILIAPGGSGMYGVGTSHQIWVSTGNCFTQAVDTGNNPISISNTNSLNTSVSAVVADWNNDGASDFWLKQPSGDEMYTFSYVPELITTISNGVGATTTITYNPINKNGSLYTEGSGGSYPTVQLDGAAYVVSGVTTSNGVGGTAGTAYAYSGAFGNMNAYNYTSASGQHIMSLVGVRAFGPGQSVLGFASIAATDQRTSVVTTTNFRTDYPYIGLVSSQTRVSGSTTLSSVTNTWASTTESGLGSTSYYDVTLTETVASGNDLNGAALPSTTTSYTYDSYNNPLTVTASVSGGSSSTMTNTFTNDTTNWILGQVATSQTENVVGSSDLTRHMSFGHDSGSGLINQAIVEPSNSTYKLEADITLDSYGHSTTTQLSGSGITTRSSSVGFDALGEFATSTTNALSQSDGAVYNASFGSPSSYTDPNSLITSYSYDTLGRPTLKTNPDGTKLAVSYAFCSGVNGGSASCPTYGAYLMQAERFASNGTTQIGPIHTTYFDALGRVIASDNQGFDGSNVRVATQYDSNLRVSETSRPYFTTGGTAKWTSYAYDALDRVTSATFPDSSETTYGYNGLTTTVTNNLSQVTSTTRNAQGLVASVTDAASHTTNYVYDAFGDVTSVTDPSGNVFSNTYDIRGRKTASADPDMGSWSYVWDVLSELTSQTDAKSQTTSLTYDLLERPLTSTEADHYSAWTYGTSSGSHNVGMLTEAKACTASGCSTVLSDKTFAYDSLARPYTSTLAIGGTNYTYTDSYDSYSRPTTETFPSGFVRNNVYNSLSYLCSATDNTGSPTCTSAGGANVFWTANTYNAELHLTEQTAGNGIVTTDTFDANTGHITNVRSGPSNNVAQFDYTWDTIGNLKERADDYQGTFEYFCYDSLNRLTNSAIGNTASSCTSSGTGITTKTVGYDNLGDITSKSDAGTYSYPASGSSSVQPHAVSSIAGTVNGTTNPSYSYDTNGNLTCEYTSTSCSGANIVRSIAVTASNMAATVTQGSNTVAFTYDDQHARVTQAVTIGGTTTTTTYLNDPLTGARSEMVVSGGTTIWHDFIDAGGQIAAERFCTGAAPCSSGATLRYFVVDHLGSTAALTDSSGSVTERLSYDSWGKRRNANGTDDTTCSLTSASTRGFTAQEHIDSMCAINLNARIYDPVIGRFMSSDTVVPNANNGQDYNHYSYVDNGPLSATDPTGRDTYYGQDGCCDPVGGLDIETVPVNGILPGIPDAVESLLILGESLFIPDLLDLGGSGGGAPSPPPKTPTPPPQQPCPQGQQSDGNGGCSPIETVVVTGTRLPPIAIQLQNIVLEFLGMNAYASEGGQNQTDPFCAAARAVSAGAKSLPPGTYFNSTGGGLVMGLGFTVSRVTYADNRSGGYGYYTTAGIGVGFIIGASTEGGFTSLSPAALSNTQTFQLGYVYGGATGYYDNNGNWVGSSAGPATAPADVKVAIGASGGDTLSFTHCN